MNKRQIVIGSRHCRIGDRLVRLPPGAAVRQQTGQRAVSCRHAGRHRPDVIWHKGNFKSLAHETKGLATIYKLADGKQTLRLTEFETSNGPDVHVYLTGAEVEKGSDAVKAAGFVDLGSMKGNKGDQNYDIPADVDLNKYKNVTIWCARFGVNFGSGAVVLNCSSL